jgi:hypothetical protein
MIAPLPWLERRWTLELPAAALPAVLERLRGTAARAGELVAGATAEALRARPAPGSWSAQEHIAHLDDLHELDEKRLDEFLARAPALTAADMGNRRTHEAGHNEQPIAAILDRLRRRRDELVARLDLLTQEQAGIASHHPRLGRTLRLVDWAYFVAEHDDHHLAQARYALQRVSTRPPSVRSASSPTHFRGRGDRGVVGRLGVAGVGDRGDGLERHLARQAVVRGERVAEAEVQRLVSRTHRHELGQDPHRLEAGEAGDALEKLDLDGLRHSRLMFPALLSPPTP